MRQSMAKSVRRDLRRSMGIGALDTIAQQDQAIGLLSNALSTCQREIATLAINHAAEKQLVTAELRALSGCIVLNSNLRSDQDARTKTCWLRLRWLFGL